MAQGPGGASWRDLGSARAAGPLGGSCPALGPGSECTWARFLCTTQTPQHCSAPAPSPGRQGSPLWGLGCGPCRRQPPSLPPEGRAWGPCYPTPPPPTCSSDLGRVLPALSLGQAAHLPCCPSACSSQKGLQSWEVGQKEPEKRPEAAEVGLQALSADPARLVSTAPRLSGEQAAQLVVPKRPHGAPEVTPCASGSGRPRPDPQKPQCKDPSCSEQESCVVSCQPNPCELDP